MLNFSGKTDVETVDQLSELVQSLDQNGPITFSIDRDPNEVLKTVWEKNQGNFSCYLVEQEGQSRTIRLERRKSCCGSGSCH